MELPNPTQIRFYIQEILRIYSLMQYYALDISSIREDGNLNDFFLIKKLYIKVRGQFCNDIQRPKNC